MRDSLQRSLGPGGDVRPRLFANQQRQHRFTRHNKIRIHRDGLIVGGERLGSVRGFVNLPHQIPCLGVFRVDCHGVLKILFSPVGLAFR